MLWPEKNEFCCPDVHVAEPSTDAVDCAAPKFELVRAPVVLASSALYNDVSRQENLAIVIDAGLRRDHALLACSLTTVHYQRIVLYLGGFWLAGVRGE